MATAAGVTYTYDADNRRVKKSNGKLYWYGLKGEVLAESDASGNITSEYIYFNGARIARKDPGSNNVYYYLGDRLGSARVIMSVTLGGVVNGIVNEADFYPYGGERVISNSLSPANTYKFTGHERDSETGLDHTEFRQYASTTGRWLSPDPARGKPGNPQSWNRYVYVISNPANFRGAFIDFEVCFDSSGVSLYCDWEPSLPYPLGPPSPYEILRALSGIVGMDRVLGASLLANGVFELSFSPELYAQLVSSGFFQGVDPATLGKILENGWFVISVTAAWIAANADKIKAAVREILDKIRDKINQTDMCLELYRAEEAACRQIPTQPEQNECISVALDNYRLCVEKLPPLPLPIP